MDKDQAMKVMAESHRETVKELKESIEGHIKVKRVLARKLHAARKENERYREVLEPIPAEEWHDDDGYVVWWRLPVEEPPYVGSPMCDDFTFNYYTHYTKLICPLEGDPHEDG